MGAKKTKKQEELLPLDRESALLEAANTIGRAGEIANLRENVDDLLQVAAAWIEMSHRLDPPPYEGPDYPRTRDPLGFTRPADTTKIPDGPGPDVED